MSISRLKSRPAKLQKLYIRLSFHKHQVLAANEVKLTKATGCQQHIAVINKFLDKEQVAMKLSFLTCRAFLPCPSKELFHIIKIRSGLCIHYVGSGLYSG